MRKTDPALHDRRRAQITAAAEACFSERGFHQASMQEIAAAAGVSLGLLYRYFDSKQALALASAARERAEVLTVLAALHDQKDVVARLVELIEDEVRRGLQPAQARLSAEILAEAARNPAFATQLLAEDGAVRTALVQLLQAQQSAGRISARLVPTALADLLLGLLDGLPLRRELYTDFHPEHCAALLGRMLRPVLSP